MFVVARDLSMVCGTLLCGAGPLYGYVVKHMASKAACDHHVACCQPQSGCQVDEWYKHLCVCSLMWRAIIKYQHRIIVGDYNCWLGFSKIEGDALGPYNLDKVNDRGQDTLALFESVGMRVTSTKLRHTLLATRGGWHGEASIDYVACSRAVHELVCQCNLGGGFLPSEVPERFDGWQSEVSKAMRFARSQLGVLPNHWLDLVVRDGMQGFWNLGMPKTVHKVGNGSCFLSSCICT
eukprot:5803340-Amphidinium_carterae.1